MRTRIGSVGYLNARPLTHKLDPERVEVVHDYPAAIAASLAAGEVDLALVPVVAALSSPDLRILGGVCIGADGPVASVLLVGETPPSTWTKIHLDGESRTSAALTRVLLAGPLKGVIGADHGDEVVIVPAAPGSGRSLARGTEAALVIGDAARDLPDRLLTRLDLAQAWKDATGLPFVFAVWAGRPALPAAVRQHVREAGLAGVAAISSVWSGADHTYLTQNLRYTFDEPALVGLRRFAALAHAQGLIPHDHPQFFGPALRARPRRSVDDLLEQAAAGDSLPPGDLRQLLQHATDADLLSAADARRMALHPSARVTYGIAVRSQGQAGWLEAAQDAGAAAVLLDAPTVEQVRAVGGAGLQPYARDLAGLDLTVLAAAGLVGGAIYAHEPGALSTLAEAVGAGLSVDAVFSTPAGLAASVDALDAFIHLVLEVGAAPLRSARATAALPVGSLVEPGSVTTAAWWRATAMLRLLLPHTPHITGSPTSVGLDASQSALFSGADDLGWVGPNLHEPAVEGTHHFEAPVAEAERALRVAGFDAVRRDVRFKTLGGPLTKLRRVRPVEERARP